MNEKSLGAALFIFGLGFALIGPSAFGSLSIVACPSSISATSSTGAPVTLSLVSPAAEYAAIKSADPSGSGFSSYYWSQWATGNYAQMPGVYSASDGGGGQPYSSGAHSIYQSWNLQVVDIPDNFGVDGSTWVSNSYCATTYGQYVSTTLVYTVSSTTSSVYLGSPSTTTTQLPSSSTTMSQSQATTQTATNPPPAHLAPDYFMYGGFGIAALGVVLIWRGKK